MTDVVVLSDEQAKAVQEAFKFGGKSLETARSFGGYVARVLGTGPEDLIGLLGGDWLRIRRAENMASMAHESLKRLERRGVLSQPATLSVALPLLTTAADEDRKELVDLWERLLAAAMDPSRQVRHRFIETIQKMDPLDAVVLKEVPDGQRLEPNPIAYLSQKLGVGPDAIELSLRHLVELGCFREAYTKVGDWIGTFTMVTHTAFGRELLRTLAD